MTYQTIFFDLDGTLIDPKICIITSVSYALKQFNITENPENLIRFIGPPLNQSFKKYYGFSDEKAMQAVIFFREYFSKKGLYTNTLYEGILELLNKLRSQKKDLLIVTSKGIEGTTEVVKYLGLDKYFDHIIASKPDLSNADKPILIREAIALYPEKSKNSFVMIGDREHDIIGAQANEIDSIGVLYGYGSEEEIKKAKPTHIVKGIKELDYLLTNVQL